MPRYQEYSAPSVGQAGCTYSSLDRTYTGSNQPFGVHAQVRNMNRYEVPDYRPDGPGPNYPPRYDTLSHGQDAVCGGYFDMSKAYPYASCDSCQTQFVERPCDGNLPDVAPQSVSEGFRRRQARRR